MLVVDPHKQQALRVESRDGEYLGAITPLDTLANNQRRRHRPDSRPQDELQADNAAPPPERNVIEQTLQRQTDRLSSPRSSRQGQTHDTPKNTPKT